MPRSNAVFAAIAAASALAISASPATGEPPSDPGCEGAFIKEGNQFFNFTSPSGNDRAAAGPGISFRTETGEILTAARDEMCP